MWAHVTMAASGTAVDDTGTDNGMPTAWVRAGRRRRSATSGYAPEKRSAELGERPAPLGLGPTDFRSSAKAGQLSHRAYYCRPRIQATMASTTAFGCSGSK